MKKTKTYLGLTLLIFIFGTSLQTASAQFHTGYYGMTTYGGTYNKGTILLFDSSAIGQQRVWSFRGGSDGALPYGNLTYDPVNGLYYGMTLEGGAADSGTIISYDPLDTTEQVVWSFRGGSDGMYPTGTLAFDTATGLLYGMTSFGGVNGYGTIFTFDPATDRDSVLWSFGVGTDGTYPQADLRYDALTHSYYGTTLDGGAVDSGAIIRYNTLTGAESVAYSFPGGAGGAHPVGSLTYNPTMGNYYGTTNTGGLYARGTIFTFNTYADTLQIGWSFEQVPDGGSPTGDLAYDASTGAMYGMTPTGGQSTSGGVIYIFVPDINAERVVWSFGFGTDGVRPFGNLTYDPYQNLYHGMTSSGGNNNEGIIFSFRPLQNIEYQGASLDSTTLGTTPYGSLVPFNTQMTTGISPVADLSSISIYPNPTSSLINITGITPGQQVAVYDYLGEKINTIAVTSATQQIDISAQQPGMYLVTVLNKDGSIASEKKVVKEN